MNELKPVRLGHIPKELDPKYEIIVKGLRHVQLKVWPPEAFEEGAEFMEMLSKSFEKAHGLRLKSAFAETLVHLLHPIRKVSIEHFVLCYFWAHDFLDCPSRSKPSCLAKGD